MGTRKTSIIPDVILGILIGTAATMLLTTSRWLWERGLEHYQELLSGCLALIGAAAAVAAVMHQIRRAQDMEDERRARREFAARAMMPHALSAVCQYANDCCLALRNLLKDHHDVEPPKRVQLPNDWKIPLVSDLAVAPLQQLLQFGSESTQQCLSELIQKLQIQQSRMESRGSMDQHRTVAVNWYYLVILDSLEIYARAEMLFGYARGLAPDAPGNPERQNLLVAAQNCDFESPRWNELKRFLKEDWLL